MTRWEYLQLVWDTRLNGVGVDAKWMQWATIHTAEREPLILMDGEPAEKRWNPLNVLSDLGSQGWELVTMEVNHGAYVQQQGQGYHAVPIQRRWWLKRPIS